jgi:hypothetical protein
VVDTHRRVVVQIRANAGRIKYDINSYFAQVGGWTNP